MEKRTKSTLFGDVEIIGDRSGIEYPSSESLSKDQRFKKEILIFLIIFGIIYLIGILLIGGEDGIDGKDMGIAIIGLFIISIPIFLIIKQKKNLKNIEQLKISGKLIEANIIYAKLAKIPNNTGQDLKSYTIIATKGEVSYAASGVFSRSVDIKEGDNVQVYIDPHDSTIYYMDLEHFYS